MGEMQFTAVTMLLLMAIALVAWLPRRVSHDKVANRSRWLMAGGLALLVVQFALQYALDLRQMGVTQAAMLNLLFFIPSSALLSLSVLNMQRQGRLTRAECWAVVPTWFLATGLIVWGIATGGEPLLAGSDRLLTAEVMASAVYAVMQLFYSVRNLRELSRMQLALDNYYAQERRGLLTWFRVSIVVLTVLSLSVPLLIFLSGWPLAAYGIFFFGGIFYLWFMSVRYLLTQQALQVRQAVENAEKEKKMKQAKNEKPASSEAMTQISQAVARWIKSGGPLRSDITNPEVAREIGISSNQLTVWVTASGHESFKQWITKLRIEEAKRVIKANPEWSNESIADHCGFSRSSFYRIFKNETGMSPTQYAKEPLCCYDDQP
ncbi:MAG: helix-turn-helix transcriptional regulator [Prevotella sp.]|nr:helix-turn-helix transcriptional regulator [Prevotella sp.]